ncbi:NAD(P)/FAD-dependent oxidoreductase [Paractinoplanes hotanensis]|uniref:NAD(P)/FAD-dependent oxidoreductase n=1 Tax=Paractinoplanes hotanensis TaxID=2906497 RepID=A0ABT0Y516_9ACTN|nr:NAD(P)/FAD-dependent oxidoreductase [Actinoplanes hotanensis]MCM4081133.1 NAD(P)/FAD-dependent oxidoreductase [Actinoplanes hotanensis]
MRRILIAIGVAMMAYAAFGAVIDDVNLVGVPIFLAAVLVLNDGIILPLVIATGALVQRVAPRAWQGWARAAAIISVSVTIVALPLVLGFGRSAANPSVLPRSYGRGLLLVLTLIWLAALARGLARRGNPARTAGVLTGLGVGVAVAVIEQAQGGMAAATADLTPGSAATITVTVIGGGLIGSVLRYRPGRLLSLVTTGVLAGLLWWAVEWLTVLPLLSGNQVSWSLGDAQASFGFLVGTMIQGGVTAGLIAAVSVLRPVRAAAAPAAPEENRPRVVIVGGGFAGVAVARRLQRRRSARADAPDVLLISDSNYQLFTPMLAGVAAGTLSQQHIGAPLRAGLRSTRILHATVESVDMSGRQITVQPEAGAAVTMGYDHLVLAVGSVPDYRGLAGLDRNAFTLKSLTDATRLREHVLRQLELADGERDGVRRRRLLTVMVAGGGFAGTELIAELRDLVHSVRRFFPRLDPEELRFVLLHSQDRILPELDERLAAHALDRLRAKGIEVRLNSRLTGVDADQATLDDGTTIATSTVVWTAGNSPSPLVRELGFDLERGAIACEATMQVRGRSEVWALGDCAAVPDLARPGEYLPPTAQHASREGAAVADNILAVLDGRMATPFRFRTIALLVALGHQDGAVQVGRWLLSGRLAWALWRGVYLTKLPGLEKRVRVSIDWLLDLFFPRDVILTEPRRGRAPRDRQESMASVSAGDDTR